jgi:hypothetical protein
MFINVCVQPQILDFVEIRLQMPEMKRTVWNDLPHYALILCGW